MKQWAERFWRAILDSDYWWLDEEAMWGVGFGAPFLEFDPRADSCLDGESTSSSSSAAPANDAANVIGELGSAEGFDTQKAS
jgi:hypothetical protein